MAGRGLRYCLLRWPIKLLGCMPLRVHYALSDVLAYMMRHILHYREKVVTVNVARSFPALKYKEIDSIVDRFYHNLSDIIVEAVWMGSTGPERFRRSRIMETLDPEPINHARETSPGGVVLLDSHCGNWELLAGLLEAQSDDKPLDFGKGTFCVVYKSLKSALWDEVLKDMRLGILGLGGDYEGYLENSMVVRHMISNRGKGIIYDFKTDQHPFKGSARLEIGEFMHQSTTTMSGSVALAVKYHMAVVYQHLSHPARGKYVVSWETISPDASKEDVPTIMRKYYNLLQRDIEAEPSNYLWSHKRWK